MINTVAIQFDSNPALWLADERVQSQLPPEYVLAYVNLLHHATMVSATTGSEYVDGEFSCTTALKRVRNLTAEAMDAMLDAELVVQVDGDRYAVDFITPQTTHDSLQERADARARGDETRRANVTAQKVAKQAAAEKAEAKRASHVAAQRDYLARKAEEPTNAEPEAPSEPVALDSEPRKQCWVCGEHEREAGQVTCAVCRGTSTNAPAEVRECPGCKEFGPRGCSVHTARQPQLVGTP